ncbi:MAG: hypothetical protein KIS92_04615 [Planctomycetota bacterium]|nr:hypothetical protein [Planctomycetota bacterium]
MFLLLLAHVQAAEPVTISMGSSSMRGEVVRMTKTEVVLRVNGKEQSIPAGVLTPKDYYACAKSLLDPKDPKATFELGEYCLKKGLKDEGKDLLTMAAAIDKGTYGAKVEALLGATNAKPEPAKGPDAIKVADNPKKEEPKKEDSEKKVDSEDGGSEGSKEWIEVTGPGGKKFKIPKQFMADDENVPARKPDEMKKFLDERLADLKSKVGGEWRMEETKHFYFFSNLKPELHANFKQEAEIFYNQIAMILQHKEGDPLWNNKCPFYMMQSRAQFAKFTSVIDQSPSAFNSGGYFMHKGRECHIVIPMYDSMGEKNAIREATNTLYHEGTHAFLQLTGNNVTIHSWLHEGMAQFIEFFKDDKNNPGRNDRVYLLQDAVRRGDILSWEEGRNRPMGGMDRSGYAFAWSRVEFLYQYPDKSALPRMIKGIKAGKSDEEAMAEVFKMKVEDLETAYQRWLKERAPKNFKRD